MSASVVDLEFDHHLKTYLSPKVYDLLCNVGITDCAVDVECFHCNLSNNGLFNWNTFTSDFTTASLKASEDYCNWVKQLAPLFAQVHVVLSTFSEDYFKVSLSSYAQWTGQRMAIIRCFVVLQLGGPTACNHALLLLTSILERSLGNLVLLKAKQCPSLLRDLLAMTELQELLSPAIINMLKLLVGPPVSLNLRNIAWHGFIRPGELSNQYAYIILCTILSIGHFLINRDLSEIPHRNMVTVSCLPTFPQLSSDLLAEIKQLFSHSFFVVPCMLPFWELALQLFQNGHFGECVVILLPQLEIALRRIFVAANNCSHRLLTAENAILFTTMNEILDQYVTAGNENGLRHVLGDSSLTLLLDCLVYPFGPRIRDRVSHGEVDFMQTSSETASYVVCACASLALRFLNPNSTKLQSSLQQLLGQPAENYSSIFHPVSVVKQQICTAAKTLSSCKTIKRPSNEDFNLTNVCSLYDARAEESAREFVKLFPMNTEINALLPLLQEKSNGNLDSAIISSLNGFQVNTLYRYSSANSSREEELLKLMIRISKLISQVSGQISEVANTMFNQWQRREMRSRQRATYGRLLHSTFIILAALKLTVVILTTTLCHIDYIMSDKLCQNQLIQFFSKICQKYCENLVSYTKKDINRWDEAAAITNQLFANIPTV